MKNIHKITLVFLTTCLITSCIYNLYGWNPLSEEDWKSGFAEPIKAGFHKHIINRATNFFKGVGWKVKVFNTSNEDITVNVSTTLLGCGFKNEVIPAFQSRDLQYQGGCFGACTSKVQIIAPIKLSDGFSIGSCSDVLVIVNKSPEGIWKIHYTDWSDNFVKFFESFKSWDDFKANLRRSIIADIRNIVSSKS